MVVEVVKWEGSAVAELAAELVVGIVIGAPSVHKKNGEKKRTVLAMRPSS